MSQEKRLTGSIALTKLQHVIMKAKGQNGEVRGLFIPIEKNMLVEKDGAVYMALNLTVKEETDQFGQNGFIAKTTDSKIWKTLDEAGKEEAKKLSPILGNVKDWSGSSANDTSGAATSEEVTEDERLPF